MHREGEGPRGIQTQALAWAPEREGGGRNERRHFPGETRGRERPSGRPHRVTGHGGGGGTWLPRHRDLRLMQEYVDARGGPEPQPVEAAGVSAPRERLGVGGSS